MARKFFVLFISLLIFLPMAFAEMIDGINYDEKYFGPISGLVSGSAPPEINNIVINGRTIQANEQGDFKVPIELSANEKYVVVEIETNGYSLSKKYLIVRHPKTTRSFEISITRSEFFKLISMAPKKPPEAEGTTTTLKTSNDKPQTAKQPKTTNSKPENTTLTTLNPSTTTVSIPKPPNPPALQPPSYPALPTGRQATKPPKEKKGWFDWFKKLMPKKEEPPIKLIDPAAEETLKNEAIIIVQRDGQQIIRGEIRNYLGQETTNQAIYEILKREAPTALEKEVNKIIARDVPTGEGLSLIKREITKVVQREAPKVIKEKISSSEALLEMANKTVRQETLKAVDQKTINNMVNNAVKAEAKKAVNEKADTIMKEQTQEFLKGQAEEKAKNQIKPPSLVTDASKWGGYDLVWEIEPGKILLVKDTSKKYTGHIFYVKEQVWLSLEDLTAEQLREVLTKGKFPIL